MLVLGVYRTTYTSLPQSPEIPQQAHSLIVLIGHIDRFVVVRSPDAIPYSCIHITTFLKERKSRVDEEKYSN